MVDEFASIGHWTAGRQEADWQRKQGVVIGIGDDAAVVEAPAGSTDSWQWVLAVDTMVETVHFNDGTMTESDIGYKALAANVSDIAAMGGIPRHALVSVSVPPAWTPERMRRLYDGIYACAERYGVAIIGGDTTSSPQHLVVAVTVVGTVEAGRALRRSGAKPGDAVFLTGPVGMSGAGLHALLAADCGGGAGVGAAAQPASADAAAAAGHGFAVPACAADDAQASGASAPSRAEQAASGVPEALVRAHRRPAPSVRAGRLLLSRGTCTSLNDVSDGLASEAWEIAQASSVRLVLRDRALPRSGALVSYASQVQGDALEWMLFGGEDYVLLGTIDAADAEAAKAEFAKEGLPFYLIGEVEAGDPEVMLVTAGNGGGSSSERRRPIPKRGFNHFA
ncbi:thiamine-monophosphate kinase [Paenibacillus curdlanolyticus YK9]|uniref:Thiamine-monophosphate kinase n=1 Tax=Paenibacillus curdlanolyticus YK9 TaxID=717606 RepID=E0I771_9BACL|nr:thiamine-monophosphate kinase [Paenibacillus curdlanolyticus YK9]